MRILVIEDNEDLVTNFKTSLADQVGQTINYDQIDLGAEQTIVFGVVDLVVAPTAISNYLDFTVVQTAD